MYKNCQITHCIVTLRCHGNHQGQVPHHHHHHEKEQGVVVWCHMGLGGAEPWLLYLHNNLCPGIYVDQFIVMYVTIVFNFNHAVRKKLSDN